MEEMREVQQPVHFEALDFPGLHPTISAYACTGILSGGAGYEHVFSAVSRTPLGRQFGTSSTSSRLFVSSEFMRTAKVNGMNGSADDILVSPQQHIILRLLISHSA